MPPIQWDAIEFEVNLPDQGLNVLPKSTTMKDRLWPGAAISGVVKDGW